MTSLENTRTRNRRCKSGRLFHPFTIAPKTPHSAQRSGHCFINAKTPLSSATSPNSSHLTPTSLPRIFSPSLARFHVSAVNICLTKKKKKLKHTSNNSKHWLPNIETVHGSLTTIMKTNLCWQRIGTSSSTFYLCLPWWSLLTTYLRHIDELPRVAQRALKEIEKATGFKALLLIGGLTPADGGDISTHMYVPYFFYTPKQLTQLQPHFGICHCNWAAVHRIVGRML